MAGRTTDSMRQARRLLALRRNGRLGGIARKLRYSREQRQAWGEKAGAATLARYGRDYYKFIRSLPRRKKDS
jgi:hypothetical protein